MASKILSRLAFLAAAAMNAQAAETNGWQPEVFTLDNGMTAVILPDHRAPVVTHMLWYRVGAADEDPGKSGLAHLFEHLMFKATRDIPAGAFSRIVARNGGRDNAFTSQDYTAYFQTVAKDHLPRMMQLEAGRMTGLLLSDEEVLPERDVVKEERRQRLDNNPGALLHEKAMATLYGDHPYAIPVIGHMQEVAALTRADALDFYARMYGPQNAILVLAGDISASELKPLAEKIYGGIAPTGPPLATILPTVRPLPSDLTVTHRDPKVRLPEIHRYWLGISALHPDRYALIVAMDLLGKGRTSHLFEDLVETQKLAVAVQAGASASSRAAGYLYAYALPGPGIGADELETALAASIAAFVAEGPSTEALQRTKNSLIAQAIYARDNQSTMANWFGSSLSLGLSVEDILAREEQIENVGRADVMRVLGTYLGDRAFLAGHLLPSGQ